MCRCRRLHGGRLAFTATIARAAGDEDTKGCGHHDEPLGAVLADDVQSTTAAAACLVLDVDDLLDPLQVSGKPPSVGLVPTRLARGRRNGSETGGDYGKSRIGILERPLQLLVIELLGACAA